jgi:PhnB protein
MDVLGPQTLGGSSVTLSMYVEDVDAFVDRAVAAGARVVRPPEDQFYGDRSAKLTDPFGHSWHFSTHIEDVTPEEMKRRAAGLYGA